MATKRIGYAARSQTVAMVNPRGGTMAAAKKKPKSKGQGGQTKPRKRARKPNPPDLENAGLAFVGGSVARLVQGVTEYVGDMATASSKSPMMQKGARLVAALLPAGIGLATEEHMPALAHGMIGQSGGASTEKALLLLSGAGNGKPPASWAKFLSLGDRLNLGDGGFIYVDEKGIGQYQGPMAEGAKELPAPTPVKFGAAIPIRTSQGMRQIVAPLTDGGVLLRNPADGSYQSLTGRNITFNGLVRVARLKGLVQIR